MTTCQIYIMLHAMIFFLIEAAVAVLLSFLLQNVYNKGTLIEGCIELAMKGFTIWKYMLNTRGWGEVAEIIYFLINKEGL